MNENLRRILEKKGPIKKIGVIGMGYVGIPSAAIFADSPAYDFVWGFQRNSSSSGYKIAMLNKGECPLDGTEPGLRELIERIVKKNKFECTYDMTKIAEVDTVTIAVETPFQNRNKLLANYDSLIEALRKTGKYMTEGVLVVIESTVTPGVTQGIARKILEEESGMRAGVDFFLAHAPERVMPGRLLKNIQEYDRVVGGIDDSSTERATELYTPILTKGEVIPVSAIAAEFSKTAENALRDLQIAAVNELAIYCEGLGIDFYDVKKAIDSLEGKGVSRAVLFPGAGVGGHCLPKDTYHLMRSLNENGVSSNFSMDSDSLFLRARNINDFMPQHMYNLTTSALESVGQSLQSTKVVILGWAYNRNTDDSRNTPAEPYRDLVLQSGAEVEIHDPYVKDYGEIRIAKDLESVLGGADVIAVFTAHDDYADLDLNKVKRLSGKDRTVIVDGRNVFDPEEVINSGFIYRGIGRGDKNNTRPG